MSCGPGFQVLGTLVLGASALWSIRTYARINRIDPGDRRPSSASLPSFRTIYRPLQAFTGGVGLLSLWVESPALAPLPLPCEARLAGLVLVVLGQVLFAAALRALGNNYSPCFGAWLPRERVRTGPYAWLRHPIYVGNVATVAGILLASASAWILAPLVTLTGYYLVAARREDRELDGLTAGPPAASDPEWPGRR